MMKAFLFALIIFVTVDASVLNADLHQRTEEDEVEFSAVAVETSHGIAVQMTKRPWTQTMRIRTGKACQPKLNYHTELWSYTTTPAEVAVNSDA